MGVGVYLKGEHPTNGCLNCFLAVGPVQQGPTRWSPNGRNSHPLSVSLGQAQALIISHPRSQEARHPYALGLHQG